MKTHRGGARVKAGFYWNLSTWALHPLSGEGGVLPGSDEQGYIKVPAVLVLLLAPVMGGLYVMFLPLIGFVLLFRFAFEKAGLTLAKTVMGAREAATVTKKSR
jgi:hypothetical protein